MTAFLDTNVLLYSISDAPEEQAKAERAQALIAAGDVGSRSRCCRSFTGRPPSLTALAPFFPTRRSNSIESWRRFQVQETTTALLELAFAIQARHRFSFWGSMIVAAARAQGCEVLWTEDMDDGRIADGMRIANPFR